MIERLKRWLQRENPEIYVKQVDASVYQEAIRLSERAVLRDYIA